MIGFLTRFVGLWLIAGGLVALVVDAAKSIAASSLVVTQLGPAWYAISAGSLISVQQFVQANRIFRLGDGKRRKAAENLAPGRIIRIQNLEILERFDRFEIGLFHEGLPSCC